MWKRLCNYCPMLFFELFHSLMTSGASPPHRFGLVPPLFLARLITSQFVTCCSCFIQSPKVPFALLVDMLSLLWSTNTWYIKPLWVIRPFHTETMQQSSFSTTSLFIQTGKTQHRHNAAPLRYFRQQSRGVMNNTAESDSGMVFLQAGNLLRSLLCGVISSSARRVGSTQTLRCLHNF